MPRTVRPVQRPRPEPDHRLDDALLDGHLPATPLPEDGLDAVRLLLRAAAGPATTAELTGQVAALAAFSRIVGGATPAHSRRLRTPVTLSTLLGAKLAIAAAASAATLGAVAVVAYTGSLPAAVQQFAHHTIGAPVPAQGSPHRPAAQTAAPTGPDVTGHSAYRLCHAYLAALATGTPTDLATARETVETAAGGADKIAAYCAAATPPDTAAPHPTGNPGGAAASHRTAPAAHGGAGTSATHPTAPSGHDPSLAPSTAPAHSPGTYRASAPATSAPDNGGPSTAPTHTTTSPWASLPPAPAAAASRPAAATSAAPRLP